MKYKPGTKVRILKCSTISHIGEVGVIRNVYEGSIFPDIDLKNGDVCFAASLLEYTPSVEDEALKPGTKEEYQNQRLDRIERKLDQLLKGVLIWEK